uniref:Polycystic kidney disease 1b n=1 Tax=Cynoglossus semilaevis TaxID=244447 RepID=A0A3P8VX02_CYNSE
MVRASSTRSLEVRGENERQRWDRETPSTLKFTYIFKECADQKKNFTIFFILLHCGVGHRQGTVTLYRTTATLLHHIRPSTPSDRVHPGKTPALELIRNLAGRPDQPTVKIHAAKSAHPTNTEITFQAVCEAADFEAEFIWTFGDSTSVRTNTRTVSKRYHRPGRFDVAVLMINGHSSITSEPFPLVIQRAVKLNRLVHQASVLQNQTVKLSCRVNIGTDLTFLWNFGDETSRLGQSTEQHIFNRSGELTVKVIVFNLVSSASLSSHIFVVDRPCQPPPVKNMGPIKLQVRRSEVVHVGVTFDTELDCDSAEGLNYSWTLSDSTGRTLDLPVTDAHRQTLILPSHSLQYDTYTAIARVQVIGSVADNNYSIKIEVIPSPPVVVVRQGTNLFINIKTTAIISLDGKESHDLDFPSNPLSYSWTCKPLSSIPASCFDPVVNISTSSAVLTFPANVLKDNFDQFQFTLTVNSGERSASSETFITATLNLLGQLSVYCHTCDGNQMNWDQMLSISTSCKDCGVSPEHLEYRWSLFLVNASSRGDTEVPFCYAADLGVPSTIIQGSSTSQMSRTSTQSQHHSLTFPDEVSSLQTRAISESRGWEQHLGLVDSEDHLSTEHLLPQHAGQVDDFGEFSMSSLSSAEWVLSLPDLGSGEVASGLGGSTVAEEGDPGSSAGRPSGVDGESFSPGDDSVFDPTAHKGEGSNLVVSLPFHQTLHPTLLDLPRDLVHTALFESYTYTGIFSSVLRVKPFSLKPSSRYMLDVTAKSRDHFVGRTQLFLETKAAPQGVRCQVLPVTGAELHTHFSIFCTSGKQDLLYEYSFSVGDKPARVLYQGRDFQYYFSLPSGDPADDFKVIIYITIRSSTHTTSTKPCPVIVQVRPSFIRDASSPSADPDLELSDVGLRNLLALLKLGNSAEVCNYISLLCSILNRLSLDAQANALEQRHIRSVLICTLCELWSSHQASWVDTIYILQDLLLVTHQVTLASVKHVTSLIQVISDQFLESAHFRLDHQTINSLVVILSHTMEAAVTQQHLTNEKPYMDNNGEVSESQAAENTRNDVSSSRSCVPASSTNDRPRQQEESVSAEQTTQAVVDVLHTAADLMLVRPENIFQQHTVTTGHMTLYVVRLNQTSAVVSSGSTTVYLPAPLLHHLFVRPHLSVVSLMTELKHNPYTCTRCSTQLSGPVVDLSLYECKRRRKIPVPSLALPIDIKLQHLPRNESLMHSYILLHSQINYHSFNITQHNLQSAIQLSVVFTSPLKNPFPIKMLFRMFEMPTPSMHHLHRVHNWESINSRITLPPSYLNAAGVGYLALLNADFEKSPRTKHMSEPISYSLSVVSSQCLSWDSHQGAWTPGGCKTQQEDGSSAVNCSCHQLRPLTVTQNQIQTSHHSEDLDLFISKTLQYPFSVSLSFIYIFLLCLWPKKTGSGLTKPMKTVRCSTVVTESLCLCICQVYIVLHGDDGVSNIRQLQAASCPLFRRNTRDTFILSTAESLGSVWGLHIWHDNSGHSPSWYLKKVEVSEVERPHGRAWFFRGQCWLAVNEGDGRVQRTLHVCTHGISFSEMLRATLSDLLADFHIWMSVYSCPCPNEFSHAQRLSVCLLLLLSYACVNAVIVSQTNEQLPLEFGILDLSAVSVETGLLSVAAALPGATAISALFRLREVKLIRSRVQQRDDRRTEKDQVESGSVNQSGVLMTNEEVKQRNDDETLKGREDPEETTSVCGNQGDKDANEVIQKNEALQGTSECVYHVAGDFTSQKNGTSILWWHCLAWVLCLLLSFFCLLLSSVLGTRFNSSQLLLWAQALVFSLVSCIFFIHPAVVRCHLQTQLICLLPPRDWCVCVCMILLLLCVTNSSSNSDHQLLNQSVREHINSVFLRNHGDWWKWTQNHLLNVLYQNESTKTERNISLREQVTEGDMVCSTTVKSSIIIRSEAESRLNLLRSGGGLDNQTVALKVHFTLFSPAFNLFTSVTLLTQQGPAGELSVSSKVQSARVHHTPVMWDYMVMVCQVKSVFIYLFVFIGKINSKHSENKQQGLMGYWKTPCNWLEVTLLTVTLVYHVFDVRRSVLVMDAAEQLQRHRTHVGVSSLASWEQDIRNLRGLILFLLTLKSASILRLNRNIASSAVMSTHLLSRLFWPMQSRFTDISESEQLLNKFFSHFYQTYYLEEFESLVDELLFRLSALTDSLHHTLPPKLNHFMEEESPITSPSQVHLISNLEDLAHANHELKGELQLMNVSLSESTRKLREVSKSYKVNAEDTVGRKCRENQHAQAIPAHFPPLPEKNSEQEDYCDKDTENHLGQNQTAHHIILDRYKMTPSDSHAGAIPYSSRAKSLGTPKPVSYDIPDSSADELDHRLVCVNSVE